MTIYIKDKARCGFLTLEAIIALALFTICIFSTITLSFGSRMMFEKAREKSGLLDLASPIISNPMTFDSQFVRTAYGNNAFISTFSTSTSQNLSFADFSSLVSSSTDQSSSSSTNSVRLDASTGSSVSFSFLNQPDTFSAYGKDTCPPFLNFSNQILSSTSSSSTASSTASTSTFLSISAVLPISTSNQITDLSVKDGFAYISTNSGSSTDPDIFIFDVSGMANDMANSTTTGITGPQLISSLDTGPGLSGIAVAGPYVFAANESSVNQLQVIDIHDRSHPILIAKAKVPLDISSSTAPYASAIFYDKGFIYLGTEKGDSPELTIWNVADPAHPSLAGRYEIGNKVEKIFVDGTTAYIASTGTNQLIAIDVSNPADLILLSTETPSGWQTQSSRAIDLFQGKLVLGRDTGGFNNTSNPEFVLYDINGDSIDDSTDASSSGTPSVSAITQQSMFDEPGGIYDVIARPPHFLVLTHRPSGQLRLDDGFGTTSAAYDISGTPVTMACDWGNVYVVSNNAPGNSPLITLIKDFHE